MYNILVCGTWVCGESWLAIKDSLTHRPSSQGWASKCPIIYSSLYQFNYNHVRCVLFVWVTFLSFLLLPYLVCYAHVFPCIHVCTMYMYIHVRIMHVHVHVQYVSTSQKWLLLLPLSTCGMPYTAPSAELQWNTTGIMHSCSGTLQA